MLRELKSISNYERKYISEHECTVYEKLDMFYFNVLITESTCTVLKSNHHIIDKIDCIINSIYTDINNFVNTNIIKNKANILQKYGECLVGFFYCPNNKPVNTDYKDNIIVGKYILGNIKSLITNKKFEEEPYVDMEYFNSDEYPILSYPEIGYIGITKEWKEYQDLLDSYIDNNISDSDFITNLISGRLTTFSHLDPSEIEGIIIRCDKYAFQVLNRKSNKTIDNKLEYYDMFLKDFINWYVFSDETIDISKDYISTVSQLFIDYINTSEFLKNYPGSADDFSPAINSYIADLDYALINNDTVKVICKCNEMYKNIYRILIHNLRYKKEQRQSSYLNENDFALWNDLVDKINPIY